MKVDPADAELDADYDKYRREFRNAVSDCQAVSMAVGGRKTDERRWWACLLFTRLCVTAMSLMKILPQSPLERSRLSESKDPLDKHWDFTSVAILGRALFETQMTLFYLGLEDISEDEWLSRLNLMQLHDHMTRKKVFADIAPEDTSWQNDGEIVADLNRKLKSRRYFSALDERVQRELLKGNRASFLNHEEILARMGEEDVRKTMGLWRWWSTYVHTFSMSYYRIPEQNRGTGVETRTEKKFISSALAVTTEIVEFCTARMRVLFPDVLSRDQFVDAAIRSVLRARRAEITEVSAVPQKPDPQGREE
jgi:hypothetical protein